MHRGILKVVHLSLCVGTRLQVPPDSQFDFGLVVELELC